MRLIDADALPRHKQLEAMGNGQYEEVEIVYGTDIDNAPTIEPNKLFKEFYEQGKYDAEVERVFTEPSDDLISRQWLLDLYDIDTTDFKETANVPLEVVIQNIKDAPTIKPSKSTDQKSADVPSGDLISRDTVLALINKAMDNTDNKDIQDYIFNGLRRDVHHLPSEVCDDCIWRVCNYNSVDWEKTSADRPTLKQTDTMIIADALRYLIKDTERHELDRTRAEELREQILQYGASMCHSAYRPKGEWIDKGEYAECSMCGAHSGTQFDGVEPIPLKTNYCPNCGARMKGGAE